MLTRTVWTVAAGGVLLAGCGGEQVPATPLPSAAPTNVAQSSIDALELPPRVKELTPVVRQDSPDVYRLAFKGMKPGTLYAWIECDGDGSTPVVVGKVATFEIDCGNPGLSGNTVEVPEGLPAFDVAVMKGLNVREVRLLVGWRP